MEAMGSPALFHNMTYATAQAMFYLVAGAQRIQMFGEVEAAHAGCGTCVAELERRVSELSGDLERSEQRYQLLVSEKDAMEEVRSGLEAKVDSLSQVNEGLMIQIESLERDAVDRDRMVTDLQLSVNVAQRDLDWLLRVGLVRVVDKLIEHPEFTNAVSVICHSAFVVIADSVRSALVSAGQQGLINASSSSPVVSVNEALLAFSSMDHASLLGLGDLDMPGIRDLCAFSGSDCTPKVMADDDDEVGHGDNVVAGGDGIVVEGAGGGEGVNVGLDSKSSEDDHVVIGKHVCVDKVVVESGGDVEEFPEGCGGERAGVDNDSVSGGGNDVIEDGQASCASPMGA